MAYTQTKWRTASGTGSGRARRRAPDGDEDRIARLQRLAGNAAVSTALARGDGRLLIQRGKEDGDEESGPRSAPAPGSGLGLGTKPKRGVSFAPDDSERIFETDFSEHGLKKPPTKRRAYPTSAGGMSSPASRRASEDEHQQVAFATALANGRGSLTWAYRGRGVAVRRAGEGYTGRQFMWDREADGRVMSMISALGAGQIAVDVALERGEHWSRSEPTLASRTAPVTWARPERPDGWPGQWDNERNPIGERDLAIIRQVAPDAGAVDDLEHYSTPGLYAIRTVTERYLHAKARSGPTSPSATEALTLLGRYLERERTSFTEYAARHRARGFPWETGSPGKLDAVIYLIGEWAARARRAPAPPTLPQLMIRPPMSRQAVTGGVLGGLLGVGGAAALGALFAGAAGRALGAKWLGSAVGSGILGGAAALLVGGIALWKARARGPAPLDYSGQLAQTQTAADQALDALRQRRAAASGGVHIMGEADRSAFVSAQRATESAAAYQRAYRDASPRTGFSIEHVMTVLIDRPPEQLTRAETGTYGRALARMAGEQRVPVPVPETDLNYDQVLSGDPDTGQNWNLRVDALSKNLRARMAMEIAEHLGLSNERARDTLEVVDTLERRAGRRAGAPVNLPPRM